ncbi:hypothetical protein [Nocardioides sp.]|uniref:hypothetical protein n=1 Tax=Nocardioides sp. TaxID=35761 RepID=UPI003565D2B8
MSTRVPAPYVGLIDDAAIFPPGNSPLPSALTAYAERAERPEADLVASFVVTDVRVPEVDRDLPLSVVVTGGAGAVAGALRLADRSPARLAGLEIALRDPDDLVGNARRVLAATDAARAEGLLDEETPVYVELPAVEPSASWLAAADVVAEAELRLKFRTGGEEPHLFPTASTLATWIDAALDRETPFKCTAGLHHAVRQTSPEGFEQQGFLNVLLATRHAFDGAGRDDVVATLERRDAEALAEECRAADLAGARRWFTSFGSCSVSEPLDDLITLGLVPTGAERP